MNEVAEMPRSRPAGWYPSPENGHVTSYWDGTRYTSRRVWNGHEWVESESGPAAGGTAPLTFDAKAAFATAAGQLGSVSMPGGARFAGLAVGCGAAALGALLPWVDMSGPMASRVSTSPASGAAVLFIALAGSALVVGWPLLRSRMSRIRSVGLGLIVALLGLFAVSNWSALGDASQELEGTYFGQLGAQVSAGGGLMLYTVGVVILVVVAGLGVVADWKRS